MIFTNHVFEHLTTNLNTKFKICNLSCWEKNIEKIYLHKLSSATSSIGKSSIRSIPSQMVEKSRFLKLVVDV